MATITFSSLPAEIHISIAEYCENNDLINLCRTSKLMKERCVWVLYRHVDLLRLDRQNNGAPVEEEYYRMSDADAKRQQFIHTLLSHPEYGKYVRSFKGMLDLPKLRISRLAGDTRSHQLRRVMQSLTHVQIVDVGTRNGFAHVLELPRKQFPSKLFQSATSVRLVGQMQYGLAKAILNAINPATLKHFCLDMVQESNIFRGSRHQRIPGDRGEDGRIIAQGAISGLLAPLTGHCTALQTLILRREGQCHYASGWHEAAEDASYIEWASLICSVQRTVKKFTFEHSGQLADDIEYINKNLGLMSERFQRFILPAILSGSWPCLTIMTLRGVRGWKSHAGNPTLIGKLRAALGENAQIVVAEQSRYLPDLWEPWLE